MYWNSPDDNTIDLFPTSWYSKYENMRATVPEGYRCDPLAPTPVLFMGSCDINGPLDAGELPWSRIFYDRSPRTFPYVSLAKNSTGFDALNRRLHAFCEKFGPPSQLYVVLPRPTSIELPFRGKLINISERESFLFYLYRCHQLSLTELEVGLRAVELGRSQYPNDHYHLYRFEQASAFLEVLCRLHRISLLWTTNLSGSAMMYYSSKLELLLRDNTFMRERFAGVARFETACPDGCAGGPTQANIAELFLRGEIGSVGEGIRQLGENIELFKTSHPEIYGRLEADINGAFYRVTA